MIELSKRQLYVFLIALMTVTQKSMYKKGKKSIRTTFTPKVKIFCYFAYVFKLLLLKYIYAYLFTPKNYFKM